MTHDEVKPAAPEAVTLAKAIIQLMDSEAVLDAARKNVPDYTAQWTTADFYADEQEAWNRAADTVYATIRESSAAALNALKELRGAISSFGGHGMPGFTDRAMAYVVMAQADEVLKREAP